MKICIFGAGGFAKEVFYLAEQCKQPVEAFIDLKAGGTCCGLPIRDESYFNPQKHLAVVATGNPQLRKKIVEKIIKLHGEDVFATLVSPSANLMGAKTIKIGKGSVICANCILTCDIEMGPFAQLNLATTIGHDVKLGAFFTTAPGVHINGKVNIGECVYFGSNAATIENLSICADVTVGAGACVTKDIGEAGIYVGLPAKRR